MNDCFWFGMGCRKCCKDCKNYLSVNSKEGNELDKEFEKKVKEAIEPIKQGFLNKIKRVFWCRQIGEIVDQERCQQVMKQQGIVCSCAESNERLMEVVNACSRWLDKDIDESDKMFKQMREKVKNHIIPGDSVVIVWAKNDGDFCGDTDEGYTFALPGADVDDESDMIVHIPNPSTPETEPQWIHLYDLVANQYVKEIWLESEYVEPEDEDEDYGDEEDYEDE